MWRGRRDSLSCTAVVFKSSTLVSLSSRGRNTSEFAPTRPGVGDNGSGSEEGGGRVQWFRGGKVNFLGGEDVLVVRRHRSLDAIDPRTPS